MLMPTMLLTTACSNSDDEIINTENPANTKGYALPVTINVTRQGDATTRASFDGSKLNFSTGDKLFVQGSYNEGEYTFAGMLDYVSDGTFSGTIMTPTEWTGTTEELLSEDGGASATLLPAGYGDYGYLSITDEGTYEAYLSPNSNKAFATSKATAVEQFSYEYDNDYSSGFELIPSNAILNFTINGLDASTEVDVVFSRSSWPEDIVVSGKVTTDGDGTATFAIGIIYGNNLKDCTLTVDGNAITLPADKEVEAGKIYNISRSVTPAPAYTLLSAATTSDYGKVVCAAGHLHDAKTAVPDGCTAVGILGKVTETGHGLILALQDATAQTWNTINGWTSVTTYAGTTLKVLPDDAARGTNLTSYTALGETAVSNWAVAGDTDYQAIFKNLGGAIDDWESYVLDNNVNAYITTGVGGSALDGEYWTAWTSEELQEGDAVMFYINEWNADNRNNSKKIRPVLGFGGEAAAAKESATVTTAPTGAAVVGVGKTTALVSGGVAEGGSLMYAVTTTNTKPASTDGFSGTVPTAQSITASGTVYVWYYVKGDDTHSDSEIAATAIAVPVADIIWDVTNVSELYVSGTDWPYEKEGITLSGNAEEVRAQCYDFGVPEMDGMEFSTRESSGGFTFTAPAGKAFTKIEMKLQGPSGWNEVYEDEKLGTGWAFVIDYENMIYTVTWKGSAAASTVGLLTGAVDFHGDYISYIAFYLSE